LTSEIYDSAYRNFIYSTKSQKTRYNYEFAFANFLKYMKLDKQHCSKLLDRDAKLTQSDIIEYIIHLKEKTALSPGTIQTYITPLRHFFDMNDVVLNWKKINNFRGEYYNVVEDAPYTHEQIKSLLEKATQRDRAIILLMASSGVRRQVIPMLRLRDLSPIDHYGLYQISVYGKTSQKYITFCTPECRREIDSYLEYRRRYGERLSMDAPLFRKTFDPDDQVQIQNPRTFTINSVSYIMNNLLNATGIRPSVKRTEGMRHANKTSLMQCHGLRKYFDTTCTLAGMDPLYVEKLMGHNMGLKASYFKPTPIDLLEGSDKKMGYVHVIDALTINDENRLKRKVKQLTMQVDKFDELQAQMARLNKKLGLE
jgi:integrase